MMMYSGVNSHPIILSKRNQKPRYIGSDCVISRTHTPYIFDAYGYMGVGSVFENAYGIVEFNKLNVQDANLQREQVLYGYSGNSALNQYNNFVYNDPYTGGNRVAFSPYQFEPVYITNGIDVNEYNLFNAGFNCEVVNLYVYDAINADLYDVGSMATGFINYAPLDPYQKTFSFQSLSSSSAYARYSYNVTTVMEDQYVNFVDKINQKLYNLPSGVKDYGSYFFTAYNGDPNKEVEINAITFHLLTGYPVSSVIT